MARSDSCEARRAVGSRSRLSCHELRIVITPEDAGSEVDSVAFSPDGQTLATGESAGVAQMWKLDVRYAIGRICQLASGALTRQQWRQNIHQLRYAPPCPSDG